LQCAIAAAMAGENHASASRLKKCPVDAD